MDTIAICRTCPRDTPQSGAFGLELRAAVRSKLAGNGINVMMVQCLGSCRRPCAVAFDAPEKARIRFSDLVLQDAGVLIQAALQYAQFTDVLRDHHAFPKTLQSRISAIAPKYAPAET